MHGTSDGTHALLSAPPSYALSLEAIGWYVESRNVSDVHVHELAGGFLVCFLTATGQHVVTLDTDELARLWSEMECRPNRRWFARRDKCGDPHGHRAQLRALGEYLDARAAVAIVLQERATGYSIEFTGVPEGDDLEGLVRVHEQVAAFPTRPKRQKSAAPARAQPRH